MVTCLCFQRRHCIESGIAVFGPAAVRRYRARFITGTVSALLAKDGGGEAWLHSLRQVPMSQAVEALSTLPGGCGDRCTQAGHTRAMMGGYAMHQSFSLQSICCAELVR